jgi:uroporphyrinogen-III synthase
MGLLRDIRVLVTRPRGQGSALAEYLEVVGATPILVPTIEIASPSSWCGLDAALTTLKTYDWVIFTSANAVHAFLTRAQSLNLPPNPRRVAVIGPGTARAAEEALKQPVDLVPERFVAESLSAALRPHAPGASMLLIRAEIARDVLPEALTRAGAKVTIAEAYRNVVPGESVESLRELFGSNPPDVVTFTSGSSAHNLHGLLDLAGLRLPEGTVLASIGPVTSASMRELGWEPTVEAEKATIPDLVAAIVSRFEGGASSSTSSQGH